MRWVQMKKNRESLLWTPVGLIVVLMATVAAAGSYDSAILSDQPFAYYRFEDGTSKDGDMVADETGQYNATYVGQPSLIDDSPGIIGGTSLELLAGTPESYVTAPLGPLGSVLGEGATFEFWIKTTDARVQKRIFGAFNTGSNTSVTIASNSGPAYEPVLGSTQVFMRKQGGGDYAAAFDQSVVDVYDGNWHHVVWTFENMASPGPDPFRVYVDGVQVPLTYGATWTSAGFADFEHPFYIANAGRTTPFGGATIEGQLDEFAVYDYVLTENQVLAHYDAAWTEPTLASGPIPAVGETDVACDVVLQWTAGESAATHDVYLGTVPSDVSEANRTNPLGVLVSEGQTAATYDPGLLEFGQTYYWRVDEVSAPPDSTVYQGSVWSFRVEPEGLPLAGERITATASSWISADEQPKNTVDSSGLSGDGLHSVEPTDMWLSGVVAAGESAWIQYEFDKVYALHQMQVWNHNTATEPLIGFGIKEATVEYSVDGMEWTSVGEVHEFVRAPGKASYAVNTTIDFGGAAARYVRITALSNWGGVLQQYGLSEVLFSYIPMWARQPEPVAGATNVDPQVTLHWRSGREAISHEVHFGTSEQAVADGTALIDVVTEPSFDVGALDLGQKYYWRINEVDDAAIDVWEGDLWVFSTKEYFTVDDFESYTDDIEAGEAIFQTWVDGWDNGTGAVVGYMEAPFAERSIVHGGRQSLPLEYNNAESPWYSETVRTFDPPQDWTIHGADTLVMRFQGRPAGFIERSSGDIVMSAAGADIFGTADQFRFVYKPLTGNATITAQVWSMDNTHAWAKAGVMIRESLNADAKHAMLVVTPGNGVSFQRRTLASDASAFNAVAGIQTPQWLKLTRTGDVFTAQYSPDGSVWQDVTATDEAGNRIDVSIPMSGAVYIGLALTSHNVDTLTVGQFTDISVAGNVSGGWETAEIGTDHPDNVAESVYVVVQDSTGRTTTVKHPDLEATLLTGWQEWRIPLSDFDDAGIRLNSVEAMTIGVGDRESPAPDGSGLIYVDDIQFGHRYVAPAPSEPNAVDVGPYGSMILEDKPFAYYRFEDDSSNDGETVADVTGRYDGVYVGGPDLVNDAPGILGGASLHIMAVDPKPYVTVPLGPLGTALGAGVTFELWVKTSDTVRGRFFGAFNTGNNTSVSMCGNADAAYTPTVGSTQIFMRREGNGDYAAAFDDSVVNIYDGNWHHVVWTAENMVSPGPDPFKVYVDGIQLPLTYDATWTSAEFADFEHPFYIASAGRAAPLPPEHGGGMEGLYDEFTVYDHVLSEERILAHFNGQ